MMSLMGRVDADPGSIFVNFNQNITSLSVASKNGYCLYSLANADNHLDKLYDSKKDTNGEEHKNFADLFLIERLFESSLVAIVSLNAPRKLKMCHFKKGNEICNYSYSNTILAVKLNRLRLVVCLEESLYIHNIHDMKVVHTIRDTPGNPQGIFALSPSDKHNYVAYPGNIASGEVQIFDATHFHAKTMIPAHDSPLAAIAFSFNGTEVATASEKGTVIRVFSSLDGTKLFEFRRGVKRCVSIASMSFSMCSEFLACTSNTETVHIFKLDRTYAETENKPVPDDWMGYISKTVSSYLPTQVADVLTQGRAFASVGLPESGIRRICAITTIQKSLRLLIASQDGFLYVYSVPSVEGGECLLIKKHDLRILSSDIKETHHAIEESPKASAAPSGPSYASAVKGEEN